MREIKFRVWDIQNERMVYEPYRFDKAWENELALWDAPYYFYEHWQDIDDGIRIACQIMQYTGLKDKNGKEIYEGDIIQNVADDGTKLSSFEIKWIDEQCRFVKWKLENVDDGARYYELSLSKFYVVIGNIYEKEQPTAIVSDLINYSDSTDTVKNQ